MIFYHYCKIETFKNLIESKVFWLSNLTQSNDNEEVVRTFHHLWFAVRERLLNSDLDEEIIISQIEVLDKQFCLETKFDQPFGTCFCTSGDVLEQWKEYGDMTRGVCLGFEFDWFNGLSSQSPHPNSDISKSVGYGSVIYHNRGLEDQFYKLCYDAIKTFGLQAWLMGIRPTFKHYSSFIKNPTFHNESEVRIVYYPSENHIAENSLGITKRIEEPFPHYNLPWFSKHNGSALREIVIGCNCPLVKEDIELMINNAGIYEDINYYNSISSYRPR